VVVRDPLGIPPLLRERELAVLMETIITFGIFLFLVGVIALPYWLRASRKRKAARASHLRAAKAGLTDPVTLHPKIDISNCIGCASCVRACPEHVLGIVDGTAAVIQGPRCVSHELCVEACPVGAITMGFGRPKTGMEIPWYDGNFQSNVPGLYLAGEVGGVGLIRNAFNQAVTAVDHIAASGGDRRGGAAGMLDVLIVGAGPAGFAAALSAKYRNLSYGVIEQDSLGGSILHYPRKKLVLTSPVELPLYGRFEGPEISKEELLERFVSSVRRFGIPVRQHEKVLSIDTSGGTFRVTTDRASFESRSVVLAIGRRGSPRKLGVAGEELPKVSYRLIEAETYTDKNLLVVGGGDSAVEAAVALARQKGNRVTLSYRRDDFVRLKEKNDRNVRSMISSGKIKIEFSSELTGITEDAVSLKTSAGGERAIPNDAVFIFAGGELPAEFLKKAGIALRTEESAPDLQPA
jgi:thioredoxin reductase (NADPH)